MEVSFGILEIYEYNLESRILLSWNLYCLSD